MASKRFKTLGEELDYYRSIGPQKRLPGSSLEQQVSWFRAQLGDTTDPHEIEQRLKSLRATEEGRLRDELRELDASTRATNEMIGQEEQAIATLQADIERLKNAPGMDELARLNDELKAVETRIDKADRERQLLAGYSRTQGFA